MELSRVHEEIDWLNVEVKRLHTYMHYEAQDYEAANSKLAMTDKALANRSFPTWCIRCAVNTLHEQCLAQVFTIPGFSGSTELGMLLLLSWQSMLLSAHGKEK